ncbi:MAG: hypothetical protein IAG10_14835 [Planctomycetaceae bacterium]|nr:hypothetical protein [Planctomycetaceae bacterium]
MRWRMWLSVVSMTLSLFAIETRAAEPVSPDLLKATIEAGGGEAKLLKLFRIKERLAVSSDENAKGSERVSVLEPPGHWWVGKNDRVKNDKEPATFLVWGWTLNALVDEKSKLESLADITIDEKPAYGIRISETITPPMDLYFHKETKRLARIQWRTDRHEFSDWKEADGAWYASKCVGYKLATDKRWYHTEILELERLKELPAGLER